MDKITSVLAILGAVSVFCAAVAKVLPPGKAQAFFAFLGTFAAPKQIAKPADAAPKDGAP